MLHQTVADTAIRGPWSVDERQESCASISAWHCVYTKPKAEGSVDRSLRRSGHDSFLPLYQMVWRDRTKVIRPLFPRYSFVQFVGPWTSVVRDSYGQEVGQVMVSPTTRRPLVVPDAVIGALKAQAQADGVIYLPEPREMRRGDVGRVLGGPLAEFTGICSRTARDRVWLLLTMLGREQEVPFARGAVEIAA